MTVDLRQRPLATVVTRVHTEAVELRVGWLSWAATQENGWVPLQTVSRGNSEPDVAPFSYGAYDSIGPVK